MFFNSTERTFGYSCKADSISCVKYIVSPSGGTLWNLWPFLHLWLLFSLNPEGSRCFSLLPHISHKCFNRFKPGLLSRYIKVVMALCYKQFPTGREWCQCLAFSSMGSRGRWTNLEQNMYFWYCNSFFDTPRIAVFFKHVSILTGMKHIVIRSMGPRSYYTVLWVGTAQQ